MGLEDLVQACFGFGNGSGDRDIADVGNWLQTAVSPPMQLCLPHQLDPQSPLTVEETVGVLTWLVGWLEQWLWGSIDAVRKKGVLVMRWWRGLLVEFVAAW